MTRLFFAAAFLLGAFAIVWMGADFVGSDILALIVTIVIGCVYLLGIVELARFRQATATLTSALANIPEKTAEPISWLEQWLAKLDPALQYPARLRIEGERAGLPTPVFTPYLVGLLVMLGLLGTFIGMVETLGGAVLALEGSTELAAIRAGLAAPIKGLGVAFGTSVAGVSASAMLGLISTLCRRERMLATRQLDSRIATTFREFSLAHQRQETLKALQMQAQAFPAVADKLQAVAGQLAQMGERLGEQLLAEQEQFHSTTTSTYKELADSVDQSLQASLAASGRMAGESIKPVVAEAMATLSQEAKDSREQLASTAKDQLQAFGDDAATANTAMLAAFEQASSSWVEQSQSLQHSLAASMQESARELAANTASTSTRMLEEVAGLLRSTEDLVQARQASEQTWLSEQRAQMGQLTSALNSELGALREVEERGQQAAVTRLAELEAGVATHLASLGKELEEPMTRLIQTASETPRAAAEVITLLRAEISSNIERDNQLLEERKQVMDQLHAVSGSLASTAERQREAIEELVSSSASALQEVNSRFNEQIETEAAKMAEVAANFSGSAAELSSLGEAFGLGVSLFSESNEKLMVNLAQLEESMRNASDRSDEQMGYYVAQAREIIDQSMLSQKEIIDDLHKLSQATAPTVAEAN